MNNEYFDDYDVDVDIDQDEDVTSKENIYMQILDELLLPENRRKKFKFYYRQQLIDSIPIAKIDSKHIIFLVNDKMKKIDLDDIDLI